MRTVYGGDTPAFPIEISKGGIPLDAADVAAVIQVEVVVYSRMNPSAVLAKYALRPQAGFINMTVRDKKAVFVLSASITEASINQELVMQVTTTLADAEHPDSQAINTGASPFCKVIKKVK